MHSTRQRAPGYGQEKLEEKQVDSLLGREPHAPLWASLPFPDVQSIWKRTIEIAFPSCPEREIAAPPGLWPLWRQSGCVQAQRGQETVLEVRTGTRTNRLFWKVVTCLPMACMKYPIPMSLLPASCLPVLSTALRSQPTRWLSCSIGYLFGYPTGGSELQLTHPVPRTLWD